MKILIFLLLLILSKPGFSQITIIYDSLTGGKSTSGTVVGGTFNNDGYQPGAGIDNQNHILYIVPGQVVSGSLEFEIKGMTINGGSNNDPDFDPAFCGMYDGRGIEEPIRYFEDFKSNFFRWNVHWRGDKKIIKSVISCANPSFERLNASVAVYPGYVRDWSAEPDGLAVDWNGSKWYKIRLEWGNNSFKVYVDGEEKWAATGPSDYVPVNHKIWIGCAPGTSKKYTATIPGLTFRNVKLVSRITRVISKHSTASLKGQNNKVSDNICWLSYKKV